MWCHHCGQDVPGIASTESREDRLREAQEPAPLELIEEADDAPIQFCCARCGSVLGDGEPAGSSTLFSEAEPDLEPSPSESTAGESTVPADVGFRHWQWELDQDLHDVRHLLEARRLGSQQDEDLWSVPSFGEFREPAAEVAPVVSLPAPKTTESATRKSPLLVWLVLSLSFMAFAGGGVLLGWSVLFERGDLWSWGLVSALGGQAGLLLGLVLFLERLWREGRRATSQISEVDQRLGHLQQSALAQPTSPSGASPFSYAHRAHAPSPQLLVTDLRHQLDALARQLEDPRV